MRPPRNGPLNTILKEAGFRFVIYVFDHEPAHVHAFGDGEVKIDIETGDVLTNKRMSRRDVSRAVAIAKERREEFAAKWREYHG